MADETQPVFTVFHLIHSFFPVSGGAQSVVHNLGRGMIAKGLDVVLLTRYYNGLHRYERQANLPIYRLGIETATTASFSSQALHQHTFTSAPRASWLPRTFSSVAFVLHTALWLICRRPQKSIIHVHNIDSPILAGILAKLCAKQKLVITFHGEMNIQRLQSNRLRKLILQAIKKLGDGVVAINDDCYRRLLNERIEPDRIFLIPNGVDTEYLKPLSHDDKVGLRRRFGYDSDAHVVLFVGSLIGLKRVDLLIRAFAALPTALSSRLVIVGDGPERRKLKDLIEQSELSSRVRMVGHIERVRPYYQISDIFVLPSMTEGLSMSLLEAMACGLSVIVTDVPGNSQVVRRRVNGLTFPVHNPSLLESYLFDLMTNAELRTTLGDTARKTVVDSYSMTAMVRAHLTMYADIMSHDNK